MHVPYLIPVMFMFSVTWRWLVWVCQQSCWNAFCSYGFFFCWFGTTTFPTHLMRFWFIVKVLTFPSTSSDLQIQNTYKNRWMETQLPMSSFLFFIFCCVIVEMRSFSSNLINRNPFKLYSFLPCGWFKTKEEWKIRPCENELLSCRWDFYIDCRLMCRDQIGCVG